MKVESRERERERECRRGRGEKYFLCAAELESGGCHGDSRVRKGKGGRGIDT